MVIKFIFIILFTYSRFFNDNNLYIYIFLLPKIKDEKGDLSDKKSKLNHEGN